MLRTPVPMGLTPRLILLLGWSTAGQVDSRLEWTSLLCPCSPVWKKAGWSCLGMSRQTCCNASRMVFGPEDPRGWVVVEPKRAPSHGLEGAVTGVAEPCAESVLVPLAAWEVFPLVGTMQFTLIWQGPPLGLDPAQS